VKRFIVTGCPRSGTRFAATLFSALGIRCGHEDVFGPDQGLGDLPVEWNGYDADSSWHAVPFLPLDDVVVLHQVRHPLEVIRSIAGIRFLARADLPNKATRAVRRNAPEIFEPESEAERAATMWRIWNEKAEEHATFTYRLEDIDAVLVSHLCGLVGLDVSNDQVERALRDTPKNVNARDRDETVSWEQVAALLPELPSHYGYDTPTTSMKATGQGGLEPPTSGFGDQRSTN
jgi:hypothetical protein